MPPKGRKRASHSPKKASPRKAAPKTASPVSSTGAKTRANLGAAAATTTIRANAAAVEAMSLSRLRSSLAPVATSPSGLTRSPAVSAAASRPPPSVASVRPGLLLRPRTRALAAATVPTELAQNEEEYRPVTAPALTVSATNEEACAAPDDEVGAVAPSPWPSVAPPFAGAPTKAFTVSSTPSQPRESLERLRAISQASLRASIAPSARAVRVIMPDPPRAGLGSLSQRSVTALQRLRAATLSTGTTATATAPTAATTAAPPRKVRVVRGHAEPMSEPAVAAASASGGPAFAIPAPRSASPKKAPMKRGRANEEEEEQTERTTAPPARGGPRREAEAPEALPTLPMSARTSSPTQTVKPFTIPAPRSKQAHATSASPPSVPSLAALRAFSVKHDTTAAAPASTVAPSPFGRASSGFVPPPGLSAPHADAAVSPLIRLAELVPSRFTDGLSPRDPGESSPLSRASLHSENLSTPLRAQLQDTRSVVERYQSDRDEPAALPFRVVAPFSSHVSEADKMAALRGSLTPGPLTPGPLMRGLMAVSAPPSASMLAGHQGSGNMPPDGRGPASGPSRRRVTGPTSMTSTFSAASRAGLSGKPRCVVFDTSSLIESQPGPLNLLMEKWIVCVPFTVLDELDKIHKDDPSKANSAAMRTDREWRKRRAHELRNWIGAALKQNSGHIRVQKRMEVVDEYDRKAASNDDSILGFAVFLKRRNETVLFVSEDKFLRIKATSELGNAYAYAELLKMIGIRK